MKKTLLILISLFMILGLSGCSNDENQDALQKIIKNDRIVFGVKYDTKPFGYLNANKKLEGFDIDLAKLITKNILGNENKAVFKQVTTSNRIETLNSGDVDMVIATMSITPKRRQIVDFSIPYYMAGQAVLVPKNSKIKTINDLNNKKVIIIFGSTAEQNLKLVAPDAILMGFKTYTEGYNALKNGVGDAMTSDNTILMGIAQEDKSLRILQKCYTREPYAIAFRKGIPTQKLQERVDFILENLRRTGDLKQLRNMWIKD